MSCRNEYNIGVFIARLTLRELSLIDAATLIQKEVEAIKSDAAKEALDKLNATELLKDKNRLDYAQQHGWMHWPYQSSVNYHLDIESNTPFLARPTIRAALDAALEKELTC